MDTISYNKTNSFEGSFGYNSHDVNDIQNETIVIPVYNSYFPLYDLDISFFKKTSIFEEAPNCNNNLFFESLNFES